jgi:hypothetical protein
LGLPSFFGATFCIKAKGEKHTPAWLFEKVRKQA